MLSSAGTSNRKPHAGAVALFALAPILSACHKPPSSETAAAPAAASVAEKPKPIHVEAITVAAQSVPTTVLLAGQVKANRESDLAANASGLVLKTMVERGSFVKAGQVIAQLDTRMSTLTAREADAALETARTQRALAETECARVAQLLKTGAITRAEYDRQSASCKTAKTSALAAETRTHEAKQTLRDATIRAPFTGTVSERYVNVGEFVRPDSRVVHIVDLQPLRLELTLPEEHLGAVKKGQIVEFEVAAFPGKTFRGTVSYIGPAVRATTRDLVFEAVVSNKEGLLRPGLFATAHLPSGKETLPVVPKGAIKQDGETLRVFAIVNGHIEERVVQTGPAQGDSIPILKGVTAGDKLVAAPDARVADGAAVE